MHFWKALHGVESGKMEEECEQCLDGHPSELSCPIELNTLLNFKDWVRGFGQEQ